MHMQDLLLGKHLLLDSLKENTTVKKIAAGLAAIVVLLTTSYIVAPEPVKAPTKTQAEIDDECTEADLADGACLMWSDMHYPGVEWQTGRGK